MLSAPAGMSDQKENFMRKETFGEFLARKRQEKRIPLRKFALQLDISAPFQCDVEKGRKAPFSNERIELVARILNMSEEDKTTMLS